MDTIQNGNLKETQEQEDEKKTQNTYKPYTLIEISQKVLHEEYLLPSIQRKFVWKERQITNLFDSLMLGYPIGTILIWKGNNKTPITNKYYKCAEQINLEFTENTEREPSDYSNSWLIKNFIEKRKEKMREKYYEIFEL